MKNQSHHIIFDPAYYNRTIGFRVRNHPTWNLNPLPNLFFKFGGQLTDKLNRLISIKDSFTINQCELNNVNFGIDFEEFFNAQIQDEYLFYKHLENGGIKSLTTGIKIDYPYSNYPLKETTIEIALTTKELESQEWEGNCNKIGGNPIWIQEEQYLKCPVCKSKMEFIFQLDSGLPDLNERNDNEIMFGNDGILYALWCKKDSVSGYLWQCT